MKVQRRACDRATAHLGENQSEQGTLRRGGELGLGTLDGCGLEIKAEATIMAVNPSSGRGSSPFGLWSFGLCGLFGELGCDASFGSFGLRHCRSGGSGGTPTQDIHAL